MIGGPRGLFGAIATRAQRLYLRGVVKVYPHDVSIEECLTAAARVQTARQDWLVEVAPMPLRMRLFFASDRARCFGPEPGRLP